MAIGTSGYPGTLDDATSLLRARALRSTALRFPVGAAETEIPVLSTTGFPPDGAVLVEGEAIAYEGITETALTGCTRGAFLDDGYEPASAHAIGTPVVLALLASHVRVLSDAMVAVQARVEDAVAGPAPSTQSGTNYTLAAGDGGRAVAFTATSAIAVTIPTGLPSGFSCRLVQTTLSRITVGAASGVTLNSLNGYLRSSGQHSVMDLVAIGTNAYVLTGNISA